MDQQSTVARTGGVRGSLHAFGLVGVASLLGVLLSGGYVIHGAAAGLVAFLVYRVVVVRMVLCRDHRRGIGLSMDGEYAAALAAFSQSEAAWTRRAWLDQRRGWLMGITSQWPFLALALYNQGYCLARLGRTPEAVAMLDEALARYPDLGPARELRGSLLATSGSLRGEDWGDLLDPPGAAPSRDDQ